MAFKVADIFADLHLKQDKFDASLRSAVNDADKAGGVAGKAYGSNFSREASRTANRGLARFGAIAGGALAIAPAAVAGVSAAAGAVTALGSALTYAASSGASAVSVFGAMGQGFVTVKLGLAGMQDAWKAYDKAFKEADPKKQTELLSKYNDLLKELSPNQADFVKKTVGLNDAWRDLRKSVGDSLFKGLGDQVAETAKVFLPQLQSALVQTGSVLNGVAKGMLKAVREGPLGKSFNAIMQGNVGILRSLGRAVVPLATGFAKLGEAMLPIGQQLADGLATAADKFSLFMSKVTSNGSLSSFFQDSFDIGKQLLGVVSSLGTALFNVVKATEGPARALLDYFGQLASTFEHWSSTLEGKSTIAGWAYDGVDAVKALGSLIGTIFKEFEGFTGRSFADFIKEIEKVVPHLADTLGPLAKALSDLLFAFVDSGAIGAIKGMSTVLTGLAKAVTSVVNAAPALVGVIAQIALTSKALQFLGVTRGVTAAGGLFSTVLWGPGGRKGAVTDATAGGTQVLGAFTSAATKGNVGPKVGGMLPSIFGTAKEAGVAGKAVGAAAGTGIKAGILTRLGGAALLGGRGLMGLLGGPVGIGLTALSFAPMIISALKKDDGGKKDVTVATADFIQDAFRNAGASPEIAKSAGSMVNTINAQIGAQITANTGELEKLANKQYAKVFSQPDFGGGPVNMVIPKAAPDDTGARITALQKQNSELSNLVITTEDYDNALKQVSATVDQARFAADTAFKSWYDGTQKAAQGSVLLQQAIDWKSQRQGILDYAQSYGNFDAVAAQVKKVDQAFSAQVGTLNKTKNGVSENRKGWMENKVALDQFSISQRDVLAQMSQGNATVKQATAQYSLSREQIIATSMAYGASKKEAKAYADQILGTPKEFTTQLKLDKAAAEAELNVFKSLIEVLTHGQYTLDIEGNLVLKNAAGARVPNISEALGVGMPGGKPMSVTIPVTPEVKWAEGVIPNLSESLHVGEGVKVPVTADTSAATPKLDAVKEKVKDLSNDEATPVIKADTSQFNTKANAASKKGNDFDGKKYTAELDADASGAVGGAATANRAIAGVHGKTVTINVVTKKTTVGDGGGGGGGGGSWATGGLIQGPGTATSDSIPTYLSNGEYVIKASSVAKYGRGTFDRFNAQKMASGGMVGRRKGESDWDLASRAVKNALAKSLKDTSDLKKFIKKELSGKQEKSLLAKLTKLDESNKKKKESDEKKAADAKAKKEEKISSLDSILSSLKKPLEPLQELRQFVKVNAKGKVEAAQLKKLTALDKKFAALTVIQEKISKAEDVLSKKQEQRQSFVDSFKNATAPNISQFGQTKGGIAAGLHTQVGQVQKFMAAVKGLKTAGFPQGLIEQIVGLGLVDGTNAANQLLALNPAAKGQTIADFTFLEQFSTKYSAVLGDEYYNAGIKAAQATVDGLKKEQARLNAVFEAAATAFIAQLKVALGLVKAPKKKATHDMGGYLATGTSLVVNNTGKPEPVLNPDQWKSVQRLIEGGGGRGRMGAPMIGHAVIRENVDLARYERQRAFRERSTRV